MTAEEQAAADAAAALAAKEAADKAAADQAAADAAAAAKKAADDAKKTPAELAAEQEAAKFRRLHEKAQKEADDAKAELKKRQDAELTETERLKKAAEEATAERDKLKLEKLRRDIAAEAKLDPELAEFLTGDEAAMREQAVKLAGKTVADPLKGGTHTQAARGADPSFDEKIAAAYKAGRPLEAIRLKREKAFGAS